MDSNQSAGFVYNTHVQNMQSVSLGRSRRIRADVVTVQADSPRVVGSPEVLLALT